MIDLLVMEEKVKKIVSIGCGNSYVATALEAIELIARLRQEEKDAARYRWLRDELEQSQGGIALFDGSCNVCDIDLFIDEATQCDEAMQCNK